MLRLLTKIKSGTTEERYIWGGYSPPVSIKETIKGYNDNLYAINDGLFNLEDLSFTPGSASIKEIKKFRISYDHYNYLKGSVFQSIKNVADYSDSITTYFYDEENPFYDILNTYIGKTQRKQIFSDGRSNQYVILNNNSGEFKTSGYQYNHYITVQMKKLESGVWILTIPYITKTFFYYPGDESVVELDEFISVVFKTELDDVVVVLMEGKNYLYNVFTHDRIEIPKDSFTNGIVVIVPSENYIDIYDVEYNEYGIYN